jgi:hypothetical protein
MAWTIGKVKITKIVEMELTGGTRFILPQATPEQIRELPWLIPQFASPEGRLTMSVHSWVVETPTRRIVVDTCIGNDKQGRGVPHWNGLDKPFLQDMEKAGYPADSIDMVVCTHLHVDHVGWNTRLVDGRWVPAFANARYTFGRAEYDYWRAHSTDAAHAAVFADSVQPVVDAGKVDLIDSDARLTEEEQIDLVALMRLGRGDGALDEWDDLRREAAEGRNGRTARYLLGEPLLSDYLAAGLDEFGLSWNDERTTPVV